MNPLRSSLSLGFALAFFLPSPASAYQIDCAILLCLAGGFPPSVPCAQARAEMIRRITPWPVEPPLQIWRCPMHAAFDLPTPRNPIDRLYQVADPTSGAALFPAVASATPWSNDQIVQIATGEYTDGSDTADVDISGPEFDFVRSIRVFSVEIAWQHWHGGDTDICEQAQSVRVGTYGTQGNFGWRASSVKALPAAFKGVKGWADFSSPDSSHCPGIHTRSVFIEWRDHEGSYGFEQVDY